MMISAQIYSPVDQDKEKRVTTRDTAQGRCPLAIGCTSGCIFHLGCILKNGEEIRNRTRECEYTYENACIVHALRVSHRRLDRSTSLSLCYTRYIFMRENNDSGSACDTRVRETHIFDPIKNVGESKRNIIHTTYCTYNFQF